MSEKHWFTTPRKSERITSYRQFRAYSSYGFAIALRPWVAILFADTVPLPTVFVQPEEPASVGSFRSHLAESAPADAGRDSDLLVGCVSFRIHIA